ncbi:MAG: DNA polymerase [Candidatus Paceibacterota bacterium]
MSDKKNKKTLVLLDSHAILHRAYHALPDFASSKGEPTGALYGLSLMLLRIIEEFKPDYVVACFDLPKPTYRHVAYESYKAGRQKTHDDLIIQIKRSREIFKAFGIPEYSLEGFEADDMLGTIVEEMKDRDDVEIIIASGDMDTLQLVGPKVKVFTLKKGIKDTIVYGEKEVRDRYGFSQKFVTDFKGLSGDQSDNITGVPGIGEKTATNLIQNFGTIEQVYEALEAGELDKFKKAGVSDRMVNLLKEHKDEATFSKMLATIRRDAPISFTLPEKLWKENVSLTEVRKILSDLEFRSLVGRAEQVLNGNLNNGKKLETPEEKIEKEHLSAEEEKETEIALWLIDSSITNPTEEDILNFAQTDDILKAQKKVFETLKKEDLQKVFEEIELPLIPIIKRMEKMGIEIDQKYLSELSVKYNAKLKELEKEIWKLCGEEFNLNSPKQLGEVLFTKLGIKGKGKKTPGGAISTKESELEKIKDLHPAITHILEYREFSKLVGTYVDAIPKLIAPDGRLHAKFIQTGSATGRFSSKDPNLQNIPIKSEAGFAIRKAFVAAKGKTFLVFDYSQVELRIAAFLSGDEKLIEIFKKGEDIHSAVASKVFNVPLEKVDYEMRRRAKVINFGIIYGMGVRALKQNLNSTMEEANKFYEDYFATFSTLAKYLEDTRISAGKLGYTSTFFGRKRRFEGLRSKIPYIRASAERMAINAPIQGTEADIVKLAMIKVNEFLKKKDLLDKAELLLQIHDELVYEVDKKEAKDLIVEIKKVMENVMDPKDTKGVPILVSSSQADNLAEA